MRKNILRPCVLLIFIKILGSCDAVSPPNDVVRSNGGGQASLRCPFSTTHHEALARLSWTRDNREKIVNVTKCSSNHVTSCTVVSRSGRYAVSGALSSGISLVINDVTLEDDGIYLCKAILRDGLTEHRVRLAVTYEPREILMLDVDKDTEVANQGTLYAIIGRPYTLNCTVPSPCNPPANISWSVGDVEARVFEQANHTSAEGAPLVTSSKVVELKTISEDTGKTISCTAMHYGLAEPLQMNATLEVGNLPEKPSGSENWISSVTVNSFVITWLQTSSGGKPQTYTVTYCEVLNPEECSEISGIRQTRTRIGNLRPFTLYRVTVKSYTVFGFSEDNESIEKSTRPLSPHELGVEGVYNSQYGRVDVIQSSNVSGPLPQGLCFQLVDKAQTAGADSQECVGVGDYIDMPRGQSWKNMALVAYGNSEYSSSSDITGTDTGVGLPVIIGASVGGSVLIIIILIIIYVKAKGRSAKTAISHRNLPPQPQHTRQPQGRAQVQIVPGMEPPTYSGVKYQEVSDPPTSPGPLGDLYTTTHSYHYARPEDQDQTMPKPNYGNGQYYSRNITMDKKTASGMSDFSERYGYMEAMQ